MPFHPVTGGTQAVFPEDDHLPPFDCGLVDLSHVERVEKEDAIEVTSTQLSGVEKQEQNSQKNKPLNKGHHPLAVFRSMEHLKFNEIKIRIDPDRQALLVSARGKIALVSFSSLNLTVKHTTTLSTQGEQFFAMGNGRFDPNKKGVQRSIARLSKVLREAFATTDTPFIKLKPQFKLSIPKEKQAKQEALKRTSSYNDDIDASAADYLKLCDHEYDPNSPTYDDDPDLGAGD